MSGLSMQHLWGYPPVVVPAAAINQPGLVSEKPGDTDEKHRHQERLFFEKPKWKMVDRDLAVPLIVF